MSRSRISGSAAAIENLPDVLVMEIIARSSCYKSVTRCKYVCKRWFNLVVSPPFVHRFLCLHRLQEPELWGLIQQFDRFVYGFVCETARIFTHWSPFSLSLSFLPCCDGKSDEKVWILASFSDLLVCCPNIYDHSAYYVCNPITKQFLVLPPHPRFSRERVIWSAFIHFALVCNPYYNACDGNVVINRGYSFKLVCFHATCMDNNSVDIFSSETGKWITLALQGREHAVQYIARVSVFNGMVLWKRPGVSPIQLEGFDTRHCCDGVSEVRVCEFGPPRHSQYDRNSCFGLFRGNLRMLRYDGCFHVWELKDGDWSMVHEVPFSLLTCEDERLSKWPSSRSRSRSCSMEEHRALLCFDPSDGDIVYLRLSDGTCTLMCNLRTRIVEVAGEDHDGTKIAKLLYRKPFNLVGVFPLVIPAWPTPLPILPQIEQLGSLRESSS